MLPKEGRKPDWLDSWQFNVMPIDEGDIYVQITNRRFAYATDEAQSDQHCAMCVLNSNKGWMQSWHNSLESLYKYTAQIHWVASGGGVVVDVLKNVPSGFVAFTCSAVRCRSERANEEY